MEELYIRINDYLLSCVLPTSIEWLVEELTPLMNQVNYYSLDMNNIDDVNKNLGLGDQALLICSNICALARMSGNDYIAMMRDIGVDKDLVERISKDSELMWIPAGLYLLGSGFFSRINFKDDQTE